jgi:transposase
MKTIARERLVFLDESGFNIAMAAMSGWAECGMRLLDHKPANWGRNLSIIGAIRCDGLVCQSAIEGAVNAETFVHFIRKTLAPRLRPDDVLVLDNLRPHKDPRVVEAVEAVGATVVYLPPYSPDLNPIEPMWSCAKRAVRAVASRTTDALKAAVRSALRHLPISHFDNWFTHCGYPQSNGALV